MPSGGVMRGRKDGTGLFSRKPSWTTASRYGSMEISLLVMVCCDSNLLRTSKES
jgi:hypothetical protein